MSRAILVLVASLIASGAALAQVPAPPQSHDRALAIERQVERIVDERELWPGFEPLSIPLAIAIGESTYLFRHPSPPEGFLPIDGAPSGSYVAPGRHAAITANSSADIGGVPTATLLVDATSGRTPMELAAVALHESFHVDQRRRHPGWVGNEGDLFLYPTEDARLLGLRRLESAALRRALAAADDAGAACWARAALGFRRERFTAMDPAFATYERRTELNEGLATYVQLRAAGEATVAIPEAEFPAVDVRERIYAIGPALAFLLDRLRPGWQAALEADDAQDLDALLEAAIAASAVTDASDAGSGGGADGAASCALTADEINAIERTAQADAQAVLTARGERRRDFEARAGWRVDISSDEGQPLWPQGFDPLNVERVEGGILHTRLLRLGNDGGELQMLDESGADVEALTEGAGPHPLFNGIRQVVIAGLAKPAVEDEEGRVSVRAPGLTLNFRGASVKMQGETVFVELRSTR